MNLIPKIYQINDTFSYERNENKPKLILIIENKSISKEEIKNANIDYSITDVNNKCNIANFFNKKHSEMIYKEVSNHYNNYGEIKNINFAYHYLIDRTGNIYSGRDYNIRPFNLDIYDNVNDEFKLMDTNSSFFSNFIIILLESDSTIPSDNFNIYSSLSTLIKYIRKEKDIKEYYCFSEIKRFEPNVCSKEDESNLKYNNPGIFFKINELRSLIDNYLIKTSNKSTYNITTFTYGQRILKYSKPINMKGNDVIQLQSMLYQLNYFNDYKIINGEYNYITSQYVKEFQEKNYINPSPYDYGVATKETLLKVLEETIKKLKSSEEKFNNSDNLTTMFRILCNEDELKPISGDDVISLQKLIKEKVSPLQDITGFYDKQTQENVRFIQKIYGLKGNLIDGNCNHLIYNYLKNDTRLKAPVSDLKLKDYGIEVALLQISLNNLNKSNILKVNGVFDENLESVIEKINRDKNNRIKLGIQDKFNNWSEKDYKICYLEEYDYLIKNFYLI